MADTNEHHHHHHHYHRSDAATKFKYKSLKAMRRKKMLTKMAFRILCGIAVIMGILVILAYTIG